MLRLVNITKRFPGVIANNEVNLQVKPGSIHALLGENGAGKTTLMNMVYGLYQPDRGEIYFEGEKCNFKTPKEAINQGIGMVHQHFMLVPTLTVLDNIILGLKDSILLDRNRLSKDITRIIEKYNLPINLNKRISEASVGEQQKVEIIKALYKGAKLLILDEPTAVLTPHETQEFFNVLRSLKEEGHSIIIITHRISEILEISDEVTILRNGQKVESIQTEKTNPKMLSSLMIGDELISSFNKDSVSNNENVILSLNNINLKVKSISKLNDINIQIHRGEILGIAGVDGNGQNELAELIAGIRKVQIGEILYEDENINNLSVRRRYEKGISYVPDDRHKDGLALTLDVKTNLMLRSYKKRPYAQNTIINHKATLEKSIQMIHDYQIKTPSANEETNLLSGGNQQKVILAREMMNHPDLLIVCQPTRGLDIGAIDNIHKLLISLRNKGNAILLISADLDEIIKLSDRIAVMYSGSIAGILQNDESLDINELGNLMGGHIVGGNDE